MQAIETDGVSEHVDVLFSRAHDSGCVAASFVEAVTRLQKRSSGHVVRFTGVVTARLLDRQNLDGSARDALIRGLRMVASSSVGDRVASRDAAMGILNIAGERVPPRGTIRDRRSSSDRPPTLGLTPPESL